MHVPPVNNSDSELIHYSFVTTAPFIFQSPVITLVPWGQTDGYYSPALCNFTSWATNSVTTYMEYSFKFTFQVESEF